VNGNAAVDLGDVQGNILRGYRKAHVRHLVLSVADPPAARRWLLDATSGDESGAPQVTTAEDHPKRSATCLNVGLTHAGLAAVGLAPASLATFPAEFVDGMASRADKLGDTGPSHPQHWKPEWRDPKAAQLMVTVHADDRAGLDELGSRVLGAGGGRAFLSLAQLDGEGFAHGAVHFGYKDNIAQPHFEGIRDPADRPDAQPLVEIGAMLLGHKTPVEDLRWEVPKPDVLGLNGCFNAFRVLEQLVEEFETFLSEAADQILANPAADELLPPGAEQDWTPPVPRHEAMRELVAAKMLGRWRSGVPLALSPTSPTPDPPVQLNDFGFADDRDGTRCPMGSHIRRCNPRDARIVQRSTNHSRRIVRRGMSYGRPFDPAHPVAEERGLLGAFLCASLIVQFEAIQYDWMNLGLQDPRITGTNDPVVGNNDQTYSSFSIPVGTDSIELRGFPRFVHARGGAYLFLPSISALRHLGSLEG
jgi:deferrochelatase/peroxidase EfeB